MLRADISFCGRNPKDGQVVTVKMFPSSFAASLYNIGLFPFLSRLLAPGNRQSIRKIHRSPAVTSHPRLHPGRAIPQAAPFPAATLAHPVFDAPAHTVGFVRDDFDGFGVAAALAVAEGGEGGGDHWFVPVLTPVGGFLSVNQYEYYITLI